MGIAKILINFLNVSVLLTSLRIGSSVWHPEARMGGNFFKPFFASIRKAINKEDLTLRL